MAATIARRTTAGSRAQPIARGRTGVTVLAADATCCLLLLDVSDLLLDAEQVSEPASHLRIRHRLRAAEVAYVDDLEHVRRRVPEDDHAVAQDEGLLDRMGDEEQGRLRLRHDAVELGLESLP